MVAGKCGTEPYLRIAVFYGITVSLQVAINFTADCGYFRQRESVRYLLVS